MLNSTYKPLCPVLLPYRGRQHYMHAFDIAAPSMPEGFDDYTGIVKGLCDAAGIHSGIAFVTVDEKVLQAGMSQRRPGPHVDGCFMPEKNRWGHGGWNHYCNHVPVERMSIIVAASVPGCRVWEGQFDAEPRNDGDLSHVPLGDGTVLEAGRGYWLSPDCIHESMLMEQDTQRSFLRIALPVGVRHD